MRRPEGRRCGSWNGAAASAATSSRNLYAANTGSNTIGKFTPAGTGSVFATTGLNQPDGLAFDSAGNLYATNFGNSTVEKFTPGGVGSVFASGTNGVNQPGFLAFTNDAGVPLPLANQVPEPATCAMLAAGAAALLARRRRRVPSRAWQRFDISAGSGNSVL